MKKQLLSILAIVCLLVNTLSAQVVPSRLVGTDYIGALTEATANDWTKGWTNYDPKTAVYGDPTDLTTLDGMAAANPVPGKKEITTTVVVSMEVKTVTDGEMF